jgi:hypothetical protein
VHASLSLAIQRLFIEVAHKIFCRDFKNIEYNFDRKKNFLASEVAWSFLPFACILALFLGEPDYHSVQLQPIPQFLTARLSFF